MRGIAPAHGQRARARRREKDEELRRGMAWTEQQFRGVALRRDSDG
jgi:hypothetical protein